MGFRWFVRQAAASMGLEGTVRNLPGGEVEVVARGPAADLARLEESLRQGPPGAQVRSIRVQEVAPPPQVAGFQILHTR